MGIQETQIKIRDRLAQLSAMVKGASAMEQTDIHRLAETIVCPILKIVLDLPNLHNLNSEKRNFPGIDLGDPSAGIGIQVTGKADAAKIRKTIRSCIRNDVHVNFPRLRFFVLTEKQKSYRINVEKDLEGKLTFNPQSDILDSTDILGIVSTLRGQRLLAVDQILKQDLRLGPAPSEPRVVVIGNCPGWLNLIPVKFPPRLYLGDIIPDMRAVRYKAIRKERKRIWKFLSDQDLGFSSDWTVFKDKIVTFHDLHDQHLPLARVVEAGTITDLATEEFYGIDQNYERVFKTLLRYCQQQFLFHLDVFWQHKIRVFVFGPREEGDSRRVVSWTGKRAAKREVFTRVSKRDSPDETYCYKHFAFRTKFHLYDSKWYASITPEWFFSFDGYKPFAFGAESVKWLKRRETNKTVFGHVKFIAHFLQRPNLELFRHVADYPFLSFGLLTKLHGLPLLDDKAWNSREGKLPRKMLRGADGLIPFEFN